LHGGIERGDPPELHLLHIIEPSLYFETDMVAIPPLAEVDEAMRNGARKRVEQQAAAFDFDVTIHLQESIGDPSRSICDFARSLPADLIVIGRQHEKGLVEHLLAGSTVERVVAHAPCSVLVTLPHGLFGESAASESSTD
jgi:nucleotide-binding universal stress UspA family protein